MEVAREATILGFNEHVQTLRALETESPELRQTITLAFFNHHVSHVLHLEPVGRIREITLDDYPPSGTTALYDAIGHSVGRVRSGIADGDRVVVTILTDGLENASREYSLDAIRTLVAQLEATGFWTFTFAGAGAETGAQAALVNIDITNVVTVRRGADGVSEGFDSLHRSKREYMEKVKRGEDTRKDFFRE